MAEKPKLAMYWAASCGGCEISIVNLHEKILQVDEAFEIVFFPCIADFKVKDVESYPDGYINVCLFNGAIRNSENEEMAHLLRRKSKVLVAYGSCAYEGCIPALSNLTTGKATLRSVYLDNPSIDNPRHILPQPVTQMPEGELHIPTFYNTVKALDQVVPVDYVVPGCPPESDQAWAVIEALITGAELPAPGNTVVGAGNSAVCDECPLQKNVKKVKRFYRPYEITPEPGICLLEQGLVCLGPATRSGCGALCPQVGMGCRGCYGPMEGVEDQGAKMLSAIASVLDVGQPGEEEAVLDKKIAKAVATVVDPSGTFYRFSMAHSLLRRVKAE
ncbi:MAG: oxidoreductase [Anaerolineae bacterium]|nr:oxidoreductase [Anaerolineae bacterium]